MPIMDRDPVESKRQSDERGLDELTPTTDPEREPACNGFGICSCVLGSVASAFAVAAWGRTFGAALWGVALSAYAIGLALAIRGFRSRSGIAWAIFGALLNGIPLLFVVFGTTYVSITGID
jgi:hypothetical protein